MCIRNYAGQSAIDVRKTEELRMLSSDLPIAVVVYRPYATEDMRMRIEAISAQLAPMSLSAPDFTMSRPLGTESHGCVTCRPRAVAPSSLRAKVESGECVTIETGCR